MSITLTIGNETFEYPTNGQNPGWGEEGSDWAEKVTEVLASVEGTNDIPLTTDTIDNNISVAENVVGLLFSAVTTRSFEVSYVVYRDDTVTTKLESGKMYGTYDGSSSWHFTVESTGDAGMIFEITTAGQVVYYSDDLSGGTHTGEIKFKSKTFDV